MDRRTQGLAAELAAQRWYVELGFDVSVPITNSKYDLLVDRNGQFVRVQVKSTSFANKAGRYLVELKTNGGNRSNPNKVTFITADNVDEVFVLTEQNIWVFPVSVVDGVGQLTLSAKYDAYRMT